MSCYIPPPVPIVESVYQLCIFNYFHIACVCCDTDTFCMHLIKQSRNKNAKGYDFLNKQQFLYFCVDSPVQKSAPSPCRRPLLCIFKLTGVVSFYPLRSCGWSKNETDIRQSNSRKAYKCIWYFYVYMGVFKWKMKTQRSHRAQKLTYVCFYTKNDKVWGWDKTKGLGLGQSVVGSG